MNNQEPQNQSKITEEANVQNRRRFIKGAAAATPVVLTLASPSVGAALCLSQILSGNTSGHPADGSCVKGNSPTYWKSPANKSLWPTGFSYGSGTSTISCSNTYSGGTTFNAFIAFNTGDTRPMRLIMCTSASSLLACFSAAMLNSVKFPNYVLTKQQVKDLYNGVITPPSPYPNNDAGKIAFLQSTW